MTDAPHPRTTQHMVGHADAIADFMAAWQGGRLHHAWLITGPRGIGKATLAYAIARWVMDPQRPDAHLSLPPHHAVVNQVIAGSCPSLCVIEPEEDEKSGQYREIGVDEARRMGLFVRMTAADDAWRVIIIDNADLLSTEGQNAILKIVEEPPPRCLILMTATQPGRLLPTIKSRSRQLKLQPLNDNELRQLAARLDVKLHHDKPWLVKHAAGSIGELIRLADLDAGALHQAIDGIVNSLPNVNWANVHDVAQKMARKEQDGQFRLVLELFNSALTDRLKTLSASGALWDDMQTKIRLAPERHLDRTATLIDLVASAAKALQHQRAA